MRSRDVTFRGVCEFFGIAGLVTFVFSLGDTDVHTPSPIARLDDEQSPAPQILLAYENVGIDNGTLAGLGDVADVAEPSPGELTVTDDVAAPLKLRRIEVVRAGSVGSSGALRAVTQNTSRRAKRANRAMPALVRAVVGKYGTLIQQAGALHNVPAQLVAAKICIENPDMLATVVTGGQATGLMQISPGTADATLRAEYKANNLLPQEVAYFQNKLGPTRWANLLAGRAVHTVAMLQVAAYNVHVGTLCYGQYLRKYTDVATGEVQVYKAAAEYNRGPRAEYANLRCNTPDELINFKGPGKSSTPAVTQQYVMLMCGPGGPMDVLTANNYLA
jgi:hypothetical protein